MQIKMLQDIRKCLIMFLLFCHKHMRMILMALISILYSKRHKNSEPIISQLCAISLRPTNFQILLTLKRDST